MSATILFGERVGDWTVREYAFDDFFRQVVNRLRMEDEPLAMRVRTLMASTMIGIENNFQDVGDRIRLVKSIREVAVEVVESMRCDAEVGTLEAEGVQRLIALCDAWLNLH